MVHYCANRIQRHIITGGGNYKDFNGLSWLLASACNKLYRKEYITTKFNEEAVYGEDGIFNYANLQTDTQIECIEACLYNVNLDNPNSINKRYKCGRLRDTIRSRTLMMSKIEAMFGQENDISRYWYEGLTTLSFTISLCAIKSNFQEYKHELHTNFDNDQCELLLKGYPLVKSRLKIHNRCILYLTMHKHYATVFLLSKLLAWGYNLKKILHR